MTKQPTLTKADLIEEVLRVTQIEEHLDALME